MCFPINPLGLNSCRSIGLVGLCLQLLEAGCVRPEEQAQHMLSWRPVSGSHLGWGTTPCLQHRPATLLLRRAWPDREGGRRQGEKLLVSAHCYRCLLHAQTGFTSAVNHGEKVGTQKEKEENGYRMSCSRWAIQPTPTYVICAACPKLLLPCTELCSRHAVPSTATSCRPLLLSHYWDFQGQRIRQHSNSQYLIHYYSIFNTTQYLIH